MPTVLRQDGFEFRIYTDDHAPSHVHVFRAGTEVVINLAGRPIVRENNRMNARNMSRAFRIAVENQEYLLQRWREIHG